MALRPSPSPSPGPPAGHPNRQARASLGPGSSLTVGTNLGPAPRNLGNGPISPRPTGMRPTSELITGSNMYQNPEAEAIDQWFENLQNYEATLEEMAAASLDVNFKEELSAIEQWFRVLSEAERTAALYSLLQHSTQVQIRFFITVLQQMARADPMTALLSPAVGASMQSQMEAKLASLGLKSPGPPASPSARSFNRQSTGPESANFLSPDSAAVPPSPGGAGSGDAAATLAQQRARLKATNAAHRISAPGTLATDAARANVWSATSLSQVAERGPSPTPDLLAPMPPGTRPKSTDFTGVAAQFRKGAESNNDDQLSPMVSGNWASMVNTPVVPMFAGGNNAGSSAANNGTDTNGQNLDAAALKLANWTMGNNAGGPVVQLDDARKFRRSSNATKSTDTTKDAQPPAQRKPQPNNSGFLSPQQAQPNWQQQQQQQQTRSPAGSGRFPTDDPAAMAANFNMAGLSPGMGMNMGMMNGFGMMTPGMGMPGFGMNNIEGLQAQLLAAQLAQLNAGFPLGMMGGLQQQQPGPRSTRSATSGRRSPKPPTASAGKGGEDEVDPALLNDVPAWLRSLRLHKYTPNFEGMHWKDMVVMDEAALEAKGVAALGARRKMLKTFQLVREKMGIEHPEGFKPE
ncbi:Protein VTS1 [Neurospora crassa OR74A] [Rhizoctonia solani]|uniref:RNA-binding protein VTS1 n=1 Tax=Rhizoctonia solani TaxID=456999 RepID=A0A0K6FUI4_9AGAM|nr:Protein VTS1 [Neurospora crassa OR74A] [Rhizoctonia solani]